MPRRQPSGLASRRASTRLSFLQSEIRNITESILIADQNSTQVEVEVKILRGEAEGQIQLACTYRVQNNNGNAEGDVSEQVVAHLRSMTQDIGESIERKVESIIVRDADLVEMMVTRAKREAEVFMLRAACNHVMVKKEMAGFGSTVKEDLLFTGGP